MLRLRGARIGRGVRIPRIWVNWPHQLQLGDGCRLEPDIAFKYDHYWVAGPRIVIGEHSFIGRNAEFNITGRIDVGRHCLIAAGSRFIDHDHGMASDALMRGQPAVTAPIRLGDDVWIGVNVVVLKGVTIGDGAVVGAGAVVTKSIPAGEIWVGNPARKVGDRKTRTGGTGNV